MTSIIRRVRDLINSPTPGDAPHFYDMAPKTVGAGQRPRPLQDRLRDRRLHLIAETDHFMLSENNGRVIRIVEDWLAHYFPVRAPEAVA